MSAISSIFFMVGRFQPFTLGHLALVNELLINTAKTLDSIAYLFVSHKELKPRHYKKVEKLYEVLAVTRDPGKIKDKMKTEDSIMDYPLNATDRVEIVLALLRKIYPEVEISEVISGEYVIRVSRIFDLKSRQGYIPLSREVELHIINSSKVENTSGYKAHLWLKRKYNNIKASMVTGSNRVLVSQSLIMANKPVEISRDEDNSTDSNHYTKLSGSKIRTWCILYHVTLNEKWLKNIVDSYYNLLSQDEVLRLIVAPINKSIFEAHAPPKSKSSAKVTVRTKRKASAPPNSGASTTNLARASSPPKSSTSATGPTGPAPPKSSASATNSVRSKEPSQSKNRANSTVTARTKRRASQVNNKTSVGTRRSKRLTRRV